MSPIRVFQVNMFETFVPLRDGPSELIRYTTKTPSSLASDLIVGSATSLGRKRGRRTKHAGDAKHYMMARHPCPVWNNCVIPNALLQACGWPLSTRKL